jgi:hypothetical protein
LLLRDERVTIHERFRFEQARELGLLLLRNIDHMLLHEADRLALGSRPYHLKLLLQVVHGVRGRLLRHHDALLGGAAQRQGPRTEQLMD